MDESKLVTLEKSEPEYHERRTGDEFIEKVSARRKMKP